MGSSAQRLAALIAACLLGTGCAVSSASFYRNPGNASILQLCKTVRSQEARSNAKFRADVLTALQRRGISQPRCQELISEQRAAVAAGLAAGALVYVAAQDGGGAGGTGSSAYSASKTDYDWDWDQFTDEYGNLVWACRGVQTGQFAEAFRCQFDVKDDYRWPTLRKYF